MTGILEDRNTILLKDFLKQLKGMKDSKEKRNFIFSNSHLINELHKTYREEEINYEGAQMLNFFKINFLDLKEYELVHMKDLIYKWNNYVIKFNNMNLHRDCLNWYNIQMKAKRNT